MEYGPHVDRDELYKECVTALLESQDLSEAETAVTCAFLQADKRLLSWTLEETQTGAEKESGSTATIMFVRSDRLLLAHVGDSRVVLSKGGKAVDLCSDHQPHGSSKSSIAEVRRIQAAGGWVSHGRVCGSLSVSRAFGDVTFKSRKKLMMEEGIKDRRWTEAFASIADAVQFVQKKLKEHANAQMWNGQDNVSVIVVDFGYHTIHPLFLLQILKF
ncbi:unnamed protein product [Sphagnum compactum]